MKKIKDLIYDYNDIFLALIIIIIAGAVIFWKTSDIMAYPTFAKSQKSSHQQTDVSITDEDLEHVDVDPITAPGEDLEGQEQEPSQQPQQQPDTQTPQVGLSKDVTFTVPSGYVCSKIAGKLEAEGLCTAGQFTSAVEKLGAETKLRAGDFKIPAGSTPEDIVKIIANIK